MNAVKAAVCCRNMRSERRRYEIDPRELLRIQRDARENGQEIVGFYHSHPDHPATWSQTDLQEAHWIGCSYVIVSVPEGVSAEVRSFRLRGKVEEDKRFEEEEMEVVDE
jgi:proteasome lid subunit RPN8/RPN11